MSKRSSTEEIDSLFKKLIKLKKKIEKIEEENKNITSLESESEIGQAEAAKTASPTLPVETNQNESGSITEENEKPNNTEVDLQETLDQKVTSDLDDDLVEILSENPLRPKTLDVKLHPELELRWKYWAIHGLKKEVKEEIRDKYPRQMEWDGAKLNAEFNTVLSESALKRDGFLMEDQLLI